MNTLTLEQEPTIIDLTFRENSFVVHLADGRRLSVPYAWYPRLAYGTAAERETGRYLGMATPFTGLSLTKILLLMVYLRAIAVLRVAGRWNVGWKTVNW